MTPESQGPKYIWVTFQKEGIHRYPEAGTDPSLCSPGRGDVSFLAHPHRHIFHMKVELEVFHDNRDVEFIQFKRYLEDKMNDTFRDGLNNMSCEMICDVIADFVTKYASLGPNQTRHLIVHVSEDGENGATSYYWI